MAQPSVASKPSGIPHLAAGPEPVSVRSGIVWPVSTRAKIAAVLLALAGIGHFLVYLIGGPSTWWARLGCRTPAST
jgi:hypothetical protein